MSQSNGTTAVATVVPSTTAIVVPLVVPTASRRMLRWALGEALHQCPQGAKGEAERDMLKGILAADNAYAQEEKEANRPAPILMEDPARIAGRLRGARIAGNRIREEVRKG